MISPVANRATNFHKKLMNTMLMMTARKSRTSSPDLRGLSCSADGPLPALPRFLAGWVERGGGVHNIANNTREEAWIGQSELWLEVSLLSLRM